MIDTTLQPIARMKLRRRVKVGLLYCRAILAEFKWTLIVLLLLVAIGATLHRMTPANLLTDNQRCSVGDSIYAGWMALLAQPQYTRAPWYLKVVYALYPLMGFILFGEGVVRLALLMISKRRGEKECKNLFCEIPRYRGSATTSTQHSAPITQHCVALPHHSRARKGRIARAGESGASAHGYHAHQRLAGRVDCTVQRENYSIAGAAGLRHRLTNFSLGREMLENFAQGIPQMSGGISRPIAMTPPRKPAPH